MKLLIVFASMVLGLAPVAKADESNCTHSFKNSEPKDFPPLNLDEEDIPSNSNYDLFEEGEFNGVRFLFGSGFAQWSIIAEDAKTGNTLAEKSTDESPENLTLEYGDHTVSCQLPQSESNEQ